MAATATLNSVQVKSDNAQTAATHTCTLDCVQQYMKLLLSFAYITTHAQSSAVYTISTTCTFVWKTLELYSVLYQLCLQVFASNRWLYCQKTRHLYYIISSSTIRGSLHMRMGRDRESRPQLTLCICRHAQTHARMRTHADAHGHTRVNGNKSNSCVHPTFKRWNANHTLFLPS